MFAIAFIAKKSGILCSFNLKKGNLQTHIAN